MQTTEQDLLKVKRGEWIKINPLRDINQIKQLSENLRKKSEDIIINDEETHLFRRYMGSFDHEGELGWEIRKRATEYGKFAEDMYHDGLLVATR